MTANRRWTLAARPVGEPRESDFALVEGPIREPADGEVLVRTVWLSLDPYMRGRMSDAPSYAANLALGDVMCGHTVSQVVESRHPGFSAGDLVTGYDGWQDYARSTGKDLRKLDAKGPPISTAIGVLGMPGMTAYVGLLDIGQPKTGETVVVSAASGAVGAVVGQLAKVKDDSRRPGLERAARYRQQARLFFAPGIQPQVAGYSQRQHRFLDVPIDLHKSGSINPVWMGELLIKFSRCRPRQQRREQRRSSF